MPWQNAIGIGSKSYICGHCGNRVASATGYFKNGTSNTIHICPHCDKPTFTLGFTQIPGVTPGNEIKHLPVDIDALYSEARRSVSIGSNTAAVLTCRKLLMNIAVSQGASESQTFLSYVEYLAAKGFVPPGGKVWVDHIREKGNEANHEIKLMTPSDAEELISFLEMLLKFIYEFPARVPTKVA